MMLISRHSRFRSGGFTLVELLLAVTLLAGLMAAAVFGFSSLHRSAQLNEGVERLETAMRFARAHAANTGRKVQVVITATDPMGGSTSATSNGSFEDDRSGASTPSLSILWEADPARAPGVFETIPSLSAEMADVSELVEIRSVGRDSKGAAPLSASSESDSGEPTSLEALSMGTSANQDQESIYDPVSQTSLGATSAEPDVDRDTGGVNPGETTITFYPDGSCDGATIVLASRDSDDVREVAVHLESVTGTTRRRWKESSTVESVSENIDSTPLNRVSPTGIAGGAASAGNPGASATESSGSMSQVSSRGTASTTVARGRR